MLLLVYFTWPSQLFLNINFLDQLQEFFMSLYKAKKITIYLLNSAVLVVFIILLAYSLKDKKIMSNLFAYTSYYMISAILIIWVVQTVLLIKTLNFSTKTFSRKYWPGLLTSLILTVLIFLSVEVKFKTLSDETNLLSVSMSMLNDKICYNATMGKYYYGNFNSINNEIEKRPLVFPFMVNLVHTLTGFRYQNPFILNFIVMFLLLSGIYISVRAFLDPASSIAAMLLVISYPVITIFGTSGGFDLLNSAFFVLIMAGTYYFIKNPSSVSLAFVLASLLVFSNIRYESIAFLVLIPALLWRRITWEHLKGCSYLVFAAPLLCLPYIWQRLLRPDAYQNQPEIPLFSFGSMIKNTELFFKNLIDFNHYLPYAGFITIASIIIFIYLIVEILRKKVDLKNNGYFLFVLIAAVLAIALIYFSHFFGDYTHPSSARLFITLSIVFAFGPVALKIFKPQMLSGTALLIISMVCFLYYHPIAVEGRFINSLKGNRTTEHCINFLNKVNDRNILIIAERPGQFTALGYGAINFAYANKNEKQILKECYRHLSSKIVVLQEIEYGSQKPTKETDLNSDFKLNTLYEIQISATEFLRISEVKPADMEDTKQKT